MPGSPAAFGNRNAKRGADVIESLTTNEQLLALAVIVLGLIVARLGSMAVGALLGLLDRRTARLTTSDKSVISPRFISVSRTVVFWLILALAVSLALQILGVGGLSKALEAMWALVPRLLVAITIVAASQLLGLVARHLVSELSENITADSLGPRLLHGAIVVIGVVLGLQQIAVNISFITQLLLILVAIVGGGLMLAFALGARQHVANLLARRELARLTVGDHIRIDKIEGDIIDIHSTGIEVATAKGIASIPAARLAETSVIRKPAGSLSG